jgi:sodium-dependent dicarboxylate transporter 2/3/5
MNAAKEKSVFQGQLIWIAPVISFLAAWSANEYGGLSVPACLTLAIALWTALWWIFEAVPIPVASLIPWPSCQCLEFFLPRQ